MICWRSSYSTADCSEGSSSAAHIPCLVSRTPQGASGTATIESKTNFLRGVREGAITASTRPLHAGRTLIVVETEVARKDGALAAKVTQTQAFHYPRA